jgi:coenzyme F420-0:L-glutamate ligase/coenzyme F420-1:gamma-L-glutamate ligase
MSGDMSDELQLLALKNIPLVEPGDLLDEIIIDGFKANGLEPQTGDLIVIAQKIVSKSEDRYRDLASVTVSEQAIKLAQQVGKDPRLVELILSESQQVIRAIPGVLIVQHRLGLIHANAGIDHSNISNGYANNEAEFEADTRVLLLPENPDQSAQRLREQLKSRTGMDVGVVINDSVGRAWRKGTMGLAIGVSGVEPLRDLCGQSDLFGQQLQATELGYADELASAASLLMGQANEARPVVLIRGASQGSPAERERGARSLQREAERDLFR